MRKGGMQMTQKKFSALYLLLCAIPYPFLAMWEDATYGSCWLYGVMLLTHIFLWRIAKRKGLGRLLFLGNSLSLLPSLLCIHLFQTEKWLWYFKPFSAVQLAVFLTTALTLWELAALHLSRRRDGQP